MYVTFAAGAPRLEDIDNFRALKVIVAVGEPPALEGVGRRDGDHIWLDRGWLESHGRPFDQDWASGFAGMVAYAEKSGWVDDSGAIRAHVEAAPTQAGK